MFRWYYLAAGYFLLQTIGAFEAVDRLIYGEWQFKSGDKLTQALNWLVILASISLFWRGFHRSRGLSVGSKLAIALAIFLICSTLWSLDPLISARRGILYLFFVIGAIGVASNLEGDEFMSLLGGVCLLSVVCSIGLLAVAPDSVIMPLEGGAFRGVFAHKNILGQVMANGILASLHCIRIGGRQRRMGIFTLIVFAVVTLATKSATALLTVLAFCGAQCVMVLLRRGGVGLVMGICLILLLMPIIVVGMVFPDPILEMLGKDPTLTGRTDLWAYVVYFISERPILGWGLMAFWSPENPALDDIYSAVGWEAPEAHNGLLELLLELGVVGTIFFGFLWARNVVIALRCLRTPAQELAISALLCCGGIFLIGMTEEVLVDPSQTSVSVFFVTGLICERVLRAARWQRSGLAQPSLLGHWPAYADTSKAPESEA